MSADMLEGKVGRIYMPKQDVAGMALHKMKARLWLNFAFSISRSCSSAWRHTRSCAC